MGEICVMCGKRLLTESEDQCCKECKEKVNSSFTVKIVFKDERSLSFPKTYSSMKTASNDIEPYREKYKNQISHIKITFNK